MGLRHKAKDSPERVVKADAPRVARKSRPFKRWLWRRRRWATGQLGMGLRWLLGSRNPEAFGILMYHRVAPWSGSGPEPTWNVTPRRFWEQLAGLLERGYTPWPLRSALASHREGTPVPRRAFVVTFDDGYENVHAWAWPILRDLRVPATVFLATAYLDQPGPFPFDDWKWAGSPDAARQLWKPLTIAQCTEMQGSGLVELGSHTHTHKVFLARPDALHEDLLESREVLRSRFGLAEAAFAFPFGIASPDLVAAARRAGLLCGLTTHGEVIRPGSDPFTWGRFAVEGMDTAGTLAAQLDGWCSLARPTWKRFAA